MNFVFKREATECINLSVTEPALPEDLVISVNLYFQFDLASFEENVSWLKENLSEEVLALPVNQRTAGNIYKIICEVMRENPDSQSVKLVYPESV